MEGDGHGGLVFVNNTVVWAWNGTCEDQETLVANASNFLELKIGAAKYTDDLYVLTKDKLFLKYPGISNTLAIPIS